VNLIALGIGAIIGAGLFVRSSATLSGRVHPSSWRLSSRALAARLRAFVMPSCVHDSGAGSAYTYSYATMGELVAWIIGWDLILEYAVAPPPSRRPGASRQPGLDWFD
jgi:APA family basic amino acid/polyamine antiporter